MWYCTYSFSWLCKNQSKFTRFFTFRKTITFENVIKLIKLAFNIDKSNYYHNIYLEKVSCKVSFCIKYKWEILIELTFLKELMLICQADQKSVIFFTIGISKIKALNYIEMSTINAIIY